MKRLLPPMLRSWHLPANPFTVTGRVFAIGTAMGLLVVFDSSLSRLLAYLGCLLVATFLFGLIYRPRLSAQWTNLPLGIAGAEQQLELTIKNNSSFDAFDLRLSFISAPKGFRIVEPFPPVSVLCVNDSLALNMRVVPLRRGRYPLPGIRFASLFPFDLFRFFAEVHPAETLDVAPAPSALAMPLGELCAERNDEDQGLAGGHSAVLEYVGSREYQAGMIVRRWDFASWARLGRPAVREYAHRSEPHVVLIVDTFKNSRRSDPALELVLSQAAGIAHAVEREGRTTILVLSDAEPSAIMRGPAPHPSGVEFDFESQLRQLAAVKGSETAANWQALLSRVLHEIVEESWVMVLTHPGNVHALEEVKSYSVEYPHVVLLDNSAFMAESAAQGVKP